MLLDFIKSPEGMGLLSAVAGGLATARRGTPLNNLGAAGMAGLLGYNNALEQQTRQNEAAWINEERNRRRRDWAKQDKIESLAPQFFSAGTPDIPGGGALPGMPEFAAQPIAGQPAKMDWNGYTQALMGIDPAKGITMMQALQKDTPFDKISPEKFTPQSLAKFASSRNYGDLVPRDKLEFVEGVGVNPFDPGNAGRMVPNPNKPFMLNPNGQIVPNQQFQSYEISKASAGAPKTSVKVENKMGESIANQIGPMVKETWTAAGGAIKTADAANRVIQAVDSGKIIAGPMANQRLNFAQAAELLGVSGKDGAEKIANTRQAMTGLAQMTLQGRQQMSGQGAITESESKLAERAMSGDITMTAAEIKQLANAAKRSAKFVYDQHQAQVANMQNDPTTAGLARFYTTAPFPGESAPSMATMRFNPATGKLEQVR